MFGPRAARFELQDGEATRRGLDETVDGAADDAAVDRRRERHLVKRPACGVQPAHIGACMILLSLFAFEILVARPALRKTDRSASPHMVLREQFRFRAV